MADTIVEATEPVPPTERDPIPAEATKPETSPPPKPSRGRVVLAIGLFLLIVSAASALVFWFFFLRYRPTARAHVPSGTNVAIRLEAADILLFGPVRDHLLPLAFEGGPSASSPTTTKEKSRATKIHDRTGVHLPADVREVIVASMDGKSWVGLLGGRIERGKFVAGLAEVAKEESWSGFHLEGQVLVGPSIVFGQADDGTIIVGTDRSIVEAALPATDEGQKIGLPAEGAVTFAIGKRVFDSRSSPIATLPQATVMQKIERASGTFVLGSSPSLSMRVEPTRPQDAAELEEGIRSTLSSLGILLLLAPDIAGEKEAIRGAAVSLDGSVVSIRAPWPYEGLDRGAAKLAAFARLSRASAATTRDPLR